MGNHYHLLLKTPLGNLSRVMRHIDGLYTQTYNRKKKSDGPLFRGRYQALLVDTKAYLLQASRYILRNPIETKKPLVKQLEKYPWSSYCILSPIRGDKQFKGAAYYQKQSNQRLRWRSDRREVL